MSEEALENNITHKNMQRAEKSYTFFSQAEETKLPFTIDDICKASGYTKETADGYYQKKWYWFLRKNGETYYCEGLHRCPKWYYIFMLRQKEMPLEDFMTFICQHTGLKLASPDEASVSPEIEKERGRNRLLEWFLSPVAVIWWFWCQIARRQQDHRGNPVEQ